MSMPSTRLTTTTTTVSSIVTMTEWRMLTSVNTLRKFAKPAKRRSSG